MITDENKKLATLAIVLVWAASRRYILPFYSGGLASANTF
jgi:hypothetical protein